MTEVGGAGPDVANSALMRAALDAALEGLVITDAAGRIVSVNSAFTAITGYTDDQVVGRDFATLWACHHDTAACRAVAEGLERDGGWSGELWSHRRNGETYREWVSISTVCDLAGAVQGRICWCRDATSVGVAVDSGVASDQL